MKVCSICNTKKELNKFYKDKTKKDGVMSRCKECNKEYSNKTNIKQARKVAQKKQDMKRKGQRWGYHLSKTYGLSEEDYFKMYEDQQGCCLICKLPEDKHKHYGKFVVDHDHSTGKVRGLLCNHCNVLIGHAKEDIRILENSIIYLKEYR